MLFKQKVLEGIADGSVTLAFRRWKRCAVRPGSRLRTAVGVVEIDAVTEVSDDTVTLDDIRRAGYASPDDLWKELARFPEGSLYRIGLHLTGSDPRIALREQGDLDADEAAEVRAELARIDSAGRRGPWTASLLRLIQELPATPAAVLAERLGRDTPALKRDVRKLKELGLTESLGTGYRLSPRGDAVARTLNATGE
ncbi:hypothetical protein [Actinomadura rubrisoli]|uniref:ASCH domain-containing protein n=1 Tax=Actinomadura rubrisoli TaxID=2530368 RepID=A0A4R5CCC7_9ACTN|nr:hypothetical protein [Actinomadura rubrisoli]TDD96446.1 hypothetical protein E1298_03120 [Actinomadura rubrisoli]